MMTPICDFVREYAASGAVRMHMPGHKGRGPLGFEELDITEFDGADDLSFPRGVIAASEAEAGRIFGCRTLYSTEGSSHCIRAMLFLACAGRERPLVVAARNAHKAFINAAVLLGFDIEWIWPSAPFPSCAVTAEEVAAAIERAERKPCAVFLTSPDYLGGTADIAAISAVCRASGVPLLVDNAHGAYLRFLGRHPMELGADMCCDSAHKTLPVLTGGAYLHMKNGSPFAARAKEAMAIFGTSSPSYLILQSLDAANPYLEGHAERLAAFLPKVERLRAAAARAGFDVLESDPLRLTLATKSLGHTGDEVAQMLVDKGVFCEFHDPDHLVMMLTPENSDGDLWRVEAALAAVPRLPATDEKAPLPGRPERVMSPREAALSEAETVPAGESAGRVLAAAAISCPPAVPVVMCGERIDERAVRCFEYYGVRECTVVKQ
jgi:arginine/lysine/ornithine decarboxylase